MKGDERRLIRPRTSFAGETAPVVDSVINSALTVEAVINRSFHDQVKLGPETPLDRWLKNNWRRLQMEDKVSLLLHRYADTDFMHYPLLRELFLEMVSFRNTLVHTSPQEYEVLLSGPMPSTVGTSVTIKDIAPKVDTSKRYPKSGLDGGVWTLTYEDAARCHEIMALMLCLFEARLKIPLFFMWSEDGAPLPPRIATTEGWKLGSPKDYWAQLPIKYFEQVKSSDFWPKE